MAATFLFWIFSMPVVTLPVAWVGALAAIAPLVRPAPTDSHRQFWHAFRRTFGRSLLLGLVDLVLGLLLYVDVKVVLLLGSPLGMVLAYGFGLVAIVGVMVNVYAWAMLAWYPKPLLRLLWLSVKLVLVHPLEAIGAATALGVLVYLFLVGPALVKGLLLFMGPGLMALAVGAAAWKALRRYPLPDDDFL
ncbi:MAG TPA: DUF624 domain-containing protein [Symbiobacteriaceae bacterium]|jgi:uncharacterized membrane protein YesL